MDSGALMSSSALSQSDHLGISSGGRSVAGKVGKGNQFEEAFFCTRRWSFVAAFEKSTLYGENSAEERGILGFRRWDWG